MVISKNRTTYNTVYDTKTTTEKDDVMIWDETVGAFVSCDQEYNCNNATTVCLHCANASSSPPPPPTRTTSHQTEHMMHDKQQQQLEYAKWVTALYQEGEIVHPKLYHLIRRLPCMVTHCDRKVSHFCLHCLNVICASCVQHVVPGNDTAYHVNPQTRHSPSSTLIPVLQSNTQSKCPMCNTSPFVVERIKRVKK